jgi:hypothetical protein
MSLQHSLGVVKGCTLQKRCFEGTHFIERDLFERGVFLYFETEDQDSIGVIPYDATVEELERLHRPCQIPKKFVEMMPQLNH